ncbi:enoyl-CoA hydratase/isomerase family protein [Amycolatopsis thermoflava]
MNGLRGDRAGAVVTLTIDRPEAHNALNAAVLAGLSDAIGRASADPAVRAVVLTGSGEKAFSAGADLKEIAAMGPDEAHRVTRAGQAVFRAIECAPVPVIAAVNGLALGGGFELALASTFPVLSERASLGLPESGLGLIPGYGGTQRLPRAVGERTAAYLMVTGHRLTAARAYELGLTPIPPVAPADLPGTVGKIAQTIAAQGPMAVRSILKALEVGRGSTMEAGLAAETGLAALAIAGAESAEGVNAFLERRPPKFPNPEATS